jgi:very-short-patch-repair endonuclease
MRRRDPLPPRGKVAGGAGRMRAVAQSATALNVAEIGASREHGAMASEIPRSVLKRLAREQRSNNVQSEAIVWRAVRYRRCEGAKFRRQAPVGNFIVDFLCYERRLIVEIDGPSHESAERQSEDRARGL